MLNESKIMKLAQFINTPETKGEMRGLERRIGKR